MAKWLFIFCKLFQGLFGGKVNECLSQGNMICKNLFLETDFFFMPYSFIVGEFTWQQ